MRSIVISFLSVVVFVFPCFAAPTEATYEITLRNRSNQLLTSAVCAIHNRRAALFTVGESASEGLAELAEDGDESAFAREVRRMNGVRNIKVGPFVSGKSRATITISTARPRGRLSCVLGMLVVSNDAFPAFLGRRLPKEVGQSRRFRAPAYDAGSEVNTESCDHVPGGPCDAHFVGLAENGVVQRHPGIQGIADLSVANHGWREPVVRGTIRRIE